MSLFGRSFQRSSAPSEPQTVFITGASSGMGQGLARRYAAPGRKLGLLARSAERLEAVAQELRTLGAEVELFVGDVSHTSFTTDAVCGFAQRQGQLDLVIAAAGLGEGRDLHERFDPHKVAEVVSVNVIGVTNTLLPAVDIMREQNSGSLVGIASVAGFRAIPGSLAYSASKAAVITLMEGLRMELSATQVHAMAICPGFVKTPMTDRNDFAMPFLVSCEHACELMVRAIERREDQYVFPLPMAALSWALKLAPEDLLLKVSPKSPKS